MRRSRNDNGAYPGVTRATFGVKQMSFVTNSYSDLLLPLRIVSHDDFATVDCTGLPLPLLGNKSWQNPAFSLGRCMRLPHCVLLQRGPNDMVAPLTSLHTVRGVLLRLGDDQ